MSIQKNRDCPYFSIWFEVDALLILEERKPRENFQRLETRRIIIKDGGNPKSLFPSGCIPQ